MSRLVEFRPGVLARQGDHLTRQLTRRHKAVTWQFTDGSHHGDPGWFSVAGPKNHHKHATPPDLLTMSTAGDRHARRRGGQGFDNGDY